MASFNLKRFIKNPRKGLENAGRSLGKGAQMAAPFLPPGFREAASIGGSIAAGGNMKDHAMSGIGAYVGSQMGGRQAGQGIGNVLRGKGGIGGVIRKLPGGLKLPNGTFPGFQNPVGPGGGAQAGGGGGFDWGGLLGGMAGKAGNFIKENPLEIAMAGLATAQGVNAAKASARQGKLSDKAINLAEQRWSSQAPLRDKGMAGLLNPSRPDLSHVFADPSNPFAVKRPINPNATAKVIPPAPLPRNPAQGVTRPFPINRLPVTVPRNPAAGATGGRAGIKGLVSRRLARRAS